MILNKLISFFKVNVEKLENNCINGEVSFLPKDFHEKLEKFLEIENLKFKSFGKNCLIIQNENFDILVVSNEKGVKNLNFLYETLLDKNFNIENLEVIYCVEKYIEYMQKYENSYLNNLLDKLNFPNTNEKQKKICKDIYILKIPKLDINEIISPAEINKFYSDIRPILNKYIIKDLSFENIRFCKEINTYFIAIVDDYIEHGKEIKISLENFLCKNNFYEYKGKSITFEDYKFLKEVN